MLIVETHRLLSCLHCIYLAKLAYFPTSVSLLCCSARHGNANRNQNAWNSFGIARKQLQLISKYPPGFVTRKLDCKFSSFFCLFMSSQEMSHLKPSQGALWLSTEAPLEQKSFFRRSADMSEFWRLRYWRLNVKSLYFDRLALYTCRSLSTWGRQARLHTQRIWP